MSADRLTSPPASPGYSGKPLSQKLGLKPGLRVWLGKAPIDYWNLCSFDATLVAMATRGPFDFGHLFVTGRSILAKQLPRAAGRLERGGMLWISWPKKSSGVTSDVTEGTLRELALPLGLVDVKVCAVTDIWSGLKFVWRRVRG